MTTLSLAETSSKSLVANRPGSPHTESVSGRVGGAKIGHIAGRPKVYEEVDIGRYSLIEGGWGGMGWGGKRLSLIRI